LYQGHGNGLGKQFFVFPHFFLGLLAHFFVHGRFIAFLQVLGLAFGIEPPHRIQNIEVVDADDGQKKYGYNFFQRLKIANPYQMEPTAQPIHKKAAQPMLHGLYIMMPEY
jgi:hypothetical protein